MDLGKKETRRVRPRRGKAFGNMFSAGGNEAMKKKEFQGKKGHRHTQNQGKNYDWDFVSGETN